jgi:HSP20 family protein
MLEVITKYDAPWVIGHTTFEPWENWFGNRSLFNFDIDIQTTDNKDSYKVEILAPAVDHTKLKLNVDGSTLILSYTETKESKSKSKFSKQSFTKSVKLPTNSNISAISADYVDGVVVIKVPKLESTKTTTTEIKIN